jgi:hypothetical protein
MAVPEGKRTESKLAVQTKVESSCNMKGNSYKLLQRMDIYYESLWKE